LSRSTCSRRSQATAGFTLIEALVALAVVAVSLSAIGSTIATTVRGVRSLDRRLALVETSRAILTGLPDRNELSPGSLSGELAGHRWRVDVRPFVVDGAANQDTARWLPQSVTIRVQSPSGGILELDTVRLRRRGGP
jgi:general secretion pathway protein I